MIVAAAAEATKNFRREMLILSILYSRLGSGRLMESPDHCTNVPSRPKDCAQFCPIDNAVVALLIIRSALLLLRAAADYRLARCFHPGHWSILQTASVGRLRNTVVVVLIIAN
jgi:hypothetical protein